MSILIVWGSNTGQTEEVALNLSELLGEDRCEVVCITDTPVSKMLEHDIVIMGASTWDIGQLQYDWDDRYDEFDGTDWHGKIVAFFGCGDAVGYGESFVDAFGILWEKLEPLGAALAGKVSVNDYQFSQSRSLEDDNTTFLGLPVDQDNESDKTEARVKQWADQLKIELGL